MSNLEHSITLINPTNTERRVIEWLKFPYKEKEGDTKEITVFLNTQQIKEQEPLKK